MTRGSAGNIQLIKCAASTCALNRSVHLLSACDFDPQFVYLKKPLQPSQVMALKWNPVALSPHTPQIRGTFLSNSSGATVDVLTTVDSITKNGNTYKCIRNITFTLCFSSL